MAAKTLPNEKVGELMGRLAIASEGETGETKTAESVLH